MVSGKVQGVGFRNYVFEKSRRLQIDGYVRNLPDGTVECVAKGEQSELEALHRVLQKGPTLSRVDRVDVSETSLSPAPGFEIQR